MYYVSTYVCTLTSCNAKCWKIVMFMMEYSTRKPPKTKGNSGADKIVGLWKKICDEKDRKSQKKLKDWYRDATYHEIKFPIVFGRI